MAVDFGDVDAVEAAAARLGHAVGDAARWSADDRHRLLQRLDRAVDALAAVRATVLVAERESGTWRGAGDRSFEAWRGRTSRTGQRSAAAQVRQADQLAAVPSVAAAVAEGRVTLDHAATIGKVAASGSPAQQAAAQSPDGRAELLELAGRVDAETFATSVTRWAATVDPARLERDHEAHRRERYLHVVDTPRGTFVKGRLDTMAGHRFTLALEALTPRPAADDDRDRGQRAADALNTMSTRILASVDTKPGGHVPAQVTMIVSEETWVAAKAERDRRRAADAGSYGQSAASPGLARSDDAGTQVTGLGGPTGAWRATEWTVVNRPGYAPATLEDGTPVPLSELAVAMCDCEIGRIVIDAAGAPLDLSRSERLFSGPQRRAVIARDRECAWPDCHMHARWAELHHIRWWDRDDGPTSVDNGVVLCSFHHHEVHRRDLTITRVPGPPRAGRSGSPPAGEVARARYEFRDRAGHVIGEPAGRTIGEQPRAASIDAGGSDADSLSLHATVAGRMSKPSGRATGREPPDDLDLTWTEDPITGARVPASWCESRN